MFLALTSVVAIWRDLNNAHLSLATGWNLTNTIVLGAFLWVAAAEHLKREPAPARAHVRAPRRRLAVAGARTQGGLS